MNGISLGNTLKRKLHMRGIVMFRKNKEEKGKVTIVTTKEQLKAAVNRRDSCIEVRGDLAKKMNWMAKLSKKKIAIIIAALTGVAVIAPVPATTGASIAVTKGVALAAGKGASIAAGTISKEAVTFLGTMVVVAILKGYNIELETPNGYLKLTINK